MEVISKCGPEAVRRSLPFGELRALSLSKRHRMVRWFAHAGKTNLIRKEAIRSTVAQRKRTTRSHPPFKSENADSNTNPAVEAIKLGSPRPRLHLKASKRKARTKKAPKINQNLRQDGPVLGGVLIRSIMVWTFAII